MNKQENIARGFRLLEDAKYVYDTLIPLAINHNRWNIVVFESYRASELLVKGIICASGYEHKDTHELHSLVSRYCNILEKNKGNMSFISSINTPDGNRYFLRFVGTHMELIKCIAGSYTILGSTNTYNPYIAPVLKRDGSCISIHQGEKRLLFTVDSAVIGDYSYKIVIPNPPPEDRIAVLNELVEALLKTRTESFYSVREFFEPEAKLVIENLHSVFRLSKLFEITDRVLNT